MFKRNASNEVPFQNAVKSVIAAIADKAISNESDYIGICFYGTVLFFNFNDFTQEKQQNSFDFEGIYLMRDNVDVPDAKLILDLEKIQGIL